MQFLLNPAHAVTEFKRVTRPGGHVVLCDVDSPFLNNYPVEPKLQKDLEYYLLEALPQKTGHDPSMGRKLYSLLHQIGLVDIQVDFEPSRIYTFAGRIDESKRENIKVQMRATLPLAIEAFGSTERANDFYQRYLDYIDRDDSYSFTPLFFAQGRVP